MQENTKPHLFILAVNRNIRLTRRTPPSLQHYSPSVSLSPSHTLNAHSQLPHVSSFRLPFSFNPFNVDLLGATAEGCDLTSDSQSVRRCRLSSQNSRCVKSLCNAPAISIAMFNIFIDKSQFLPKVVYLQIL